MVMENNIQLEQNTSFTFKCKLCGNCCKEMLIRLTPFDILNLAKSLKIPTYEFISDYVVFLKTPNAPWLIAALKHVKRGECMFKQGKKCKVHPNRPLPCRLFPLGRKDEGFILHKTSYCKGLDSDITFTLPEWLGESEANPFLDMTKEFYKFMEDISGKYNLELLSTKKSKMFYKLLYDYDSASLESTISIDREEDKTRFCLQMAEWFLDFTLDKELSDEDFLIAYEKHALLVQKKLKS